LPYPSIFSFFEPSKEKIAEDFIKRSLAGIKIKESTFQITTTDGFIFYKMIQSKVVFVRETCQFVVLDPLTLLDAELSIKNGTYITDTLFIAKQSVARWELVDESAQDVKVTDIFIH
jgi:hypothetical protein